MHCFLTFILSSVAAAVETRGRALVTDLEYNIKILEERRLNLQNTIAFAEKEQDMELKEYEAMSQCTGIIDDDILIEFAISGGGVVTRIAGGPLCASEDMYEMHFDKAVLLARKLAHTGSEDVEMKGPNPDPNANRLSCALARLIRVPQLGISEEDLVDSEVEAGFLDGCFEESTAQEQTDHRLFQRLLHRLNAA